MRIIVTCDGIKELFSKDSHEESSQINNRNHSHSIIAYKHRNTRNSVNSKPSFRRNNSILSPSMLSSSSNISIPKVIELKKRKLNVPTNQGFLYESDHQINPLIVKQMPEVINSIHSNNSSSLPILKESYSLNELIPKECLDKLNDKLVHDHNLQHFDIKLDEKIFRNHKTGKEIFNEISKAKDHQIDSNHTNLIEYLVGKKTVSVRLLQNLASYEDNRINHLNKICQRVLVGNENEKLFQEKVKSKMLSKNKLKGTNIKENITTIKDHINIANSIIDSKYKNIKDKNFYYKDIHNKLLQHWKDNNYDRFCFDNNQRKNKLCNQYASSKSDKYYQECMYKNSND